MEYELLNYKGNEIRIVPKEDKEHFTGCYVRTVWFPDLDKAKDFVDRMMVHQDVNI